MVEESLRGETLLFHEAQESVFIVFLFIVVGSNGGRETEVEVELMQLDIAIVIQVDHH